MTDLVGLIGTTLTIGKGLYEICKEYDNAILLKQISDLNIQLAQVQNEAAKMITELRILNAVADEQENNPLKYDGLVYRDNDNHPYCPMCYDGQRKRIHLEVIHQSGGNHFRCHFCHTRLGIWL